MASNNSSPFAVVNGVVTYNGVPVDQVSDADRQAAFGRLGDIRFGWGNHYDQRFYDDVGGGATDDSGQARVEYRLKPQYQRWDGLMQVGIPRSVGGYSEVNDPSQISWDDDLGWVTHVNNLNGPDEGGFASRLGRILPYALAAGGLGAVGMTGGFSGLLGGASGGGVFPAGAGIAGPSLETAGIATGALDGLGAAGAAAEGLSSGLFPPGAGPGTGPLLETAGAATNTPWYTQALANAGANLSANPMMAARGLMGAAQLANSLANRGSGNNGSVSTTGSDMNPLLNLPAFNPLGLLANYKPREIKPIPFMTGTGLL